MSGYLAGQAVVHRILGAGQVVNPAPVPGDARSVRVQFDEHIQQSFGFQAWPLLVLREDLVPRPGTLCPTCQHPTLSPCPCEQDAEREPGGCEACGQAQCECPDTSMGVRHE